jgi:hypothetical protein
MYPPTPTPYPSGIPPVDISGIDAFRIWQVAPVAVNMWNSWLGTPATTIAQIAIIMGILILFVALVIRWAQGLTNEGEL